MLDELLGGALIGLAASLLWLGIGRISGMTGVLSSLFLLSKSGQWSRRSWSFWFLLGLVLAWPLYHLFGAEAPIHITTNSGLLMLAGVLVGFGTYVGNGCTSGHGVCGMGRLSVRSMVATVTFIVAGMITVALMNLLGVQP
ncbi:YeeE/YedE family protein [Parathalassolituus penaei]|mgnify:CR=1 FL=1|uniref:YeeE/YedE thiosulfate transporter family protein n=1 Tax=Parathalassolituus penaei TaxID=2997323 RepID=A0A9X3EHE9_9GAMM|nr:YeeE/YedE thiosulfate transporter family protein [Parathalassolituus penaei]MCY0967260.1 YeeE/YedE thiosulfate transporter family protein [Parathalassolituus penaei]